MHNINDVPPPEPTPPSDSSYVNRSTGGMNCRSRTLVGLGMLLVLALGLFAGWNWGHASAISPGTTALGGNPFQLGNSANSTDGVREDVIKKFKPSVVQINVQSHGAGGLGSGVIVDKRGYIVTNDHVISGAQSINVELFDGTTVSSQVVGTDTLDDLAVVKIDPSKMKQLAVASIGDSSKLQVGEEVLAIGNPLGITQTVTNGIVSALDRNVSEGPNGALIPGAIQTDASINPGNSGGALVDLNGDLVGVPTLTAIDPDFKTPANGVGFAIPANTVKFIAPQLINHGRVIHSGRAGLGVQTVSVDPVIASQNHLPVDHGALIAHLTPHGAADQAGLKTGDIITQIDDTQITDALLLRDALLTKSPGDMVTVHIYRGNQQQNVKVKLGELPGSPQ